MNHTLFTTRQKSVEPNGLAASRQELDLPQPIFDDEGETHESHTVYRSTKIG